MSDRTLPLGILDLSKLAGGTAHHALEGTIALACDAERLGYRRFWVAEHHVKDASHSCPEVVVAVIAARTSSIRVGAGAVLLRYYSPLKVAETFLALEALFPGRIDLGVAKGPGVVDTAVAEALVSGNVWELGDEVFDWKVHDLMQHLAVSTSGANVPAPVARPRLAGPPPMWLLGAGPASATLAARLRTPYAVAGFTTTPERAIEQVARFRAATGAAIGAAASGPTVLAISVTVAETPAAARTRDAALVDAGYLPANVTGDAPDVARRLNELRRHSGVDELILTTFTPDIDERRATFAALAEVSSNNAATIIN